MRTFLRGKFTLLFMTCAIVLAVPAIALADNAVSDGDGVTPIANQDMAFGNVACGVESEKDALIAITRNGSGTQVFKDGATVTVSVLSVSGGVSAAMDSSTITLPSNWGSQINNTLSGNVASTVKINPSASGAGSGTVTYRATGLNTSNNTITRDDIMNVSWTAGQLRHHGAVRLLDCDGKHEPDEHDGQRELERDLQRERHRR